MCVALREVIGPITSRRGSVRDDQHVDREVLRCPAFGRRAAHDLCERRAELLLHEALEGLTRLPDVVDVVALLALAGAVDYQPLRRLVFPHGGGVPKHLLGDVVVDLLRELRRCRQDSNRHLASSWFSWTPDSRPLRSGWAAKAKHAGPSRTSCHVGSLDAEPYGALWLQPVAIGGKSDRRRRGQTSQNSCRGVRPPGIH